MGGKKVLPATVDGKVSLRSVAFTNFAGLIKGGLETSLSILSEPGCLSLPQSDSLNVHSGVFPCLTEVRRFQFHLDGVADFYRSNSENCRNLIIWGLY